MTTTIDTENKRALTSRNVVTVACKLPHGIVIRDFAESIVHENVMGGGQRKVKVHRPVGRPIRIKGPMVPKPFIGLVEVVGGFAITQGVDGGVFARWLDANEQSSFVVNNMIYGHEDGDRVRGWARERAGIKSGLEPLDVSMKSDQGRMVYQDPRVVVATADMFKAGADLNVA